LGKETELVHIDQRDFDALEISYSMKGDVFPFNSRRDAEFSLEKTRKHLNYKSTPFNEWMTTTIRWYLEEYKKHSVGYDHRKDELDIIESLTKDLEK
jgi:hypothetical protein